jgi:peroxiredoxin
MANDLTGDFDVVAEFAVPAANRLLAAMHRIRRFPHSIAILVDDTPRPGLHVNPSAIEIVDVFGETVVDPGRIRTPNVLSAAEGASQAVYAALDTVVNSDLAGIYVPPIVPSLLKGRAQLQLSPPAMEIAAGSGSRITVRLQIMSRYLPDPHTSPAAEFLRGELQITAGVDQIASQVANVLDIDIKADRVLVRFTPTWSSRALTAEDLAGIELLIRNALKNSFLPSNIALPPSIRSLRLKTLTGAQNAIAVLLNTTGAAGNPNTAHNVFLDGGDDFAFAAGADFVQAAFQPTVDQIMSRPVPPVLFDIDTLVYTYHIKYTIVLNSAAVVLETGAIVLTVQGHAHTDRSWLPDFDFTVRQPFTLSVDGATADLVVGDMSLDTSSWIVNQFRGGAVRNLSGLRDRALNQSGARAMVRRMLSADANLGGFLRSLLTPARPQPDTPPEEVVFAYTSIDIKPSGIVLHGSLSVSGWPAPHVEFSQIPDEGGGLVAGGVVPRGPRYSAFKSWIPGGTIQSYEWKPFGQSQPGAIDDHKFVRLPPEPEISTADAQIAVSGYVPLCLTIRGSRLSSSGPVVAQPVSATVCGFDLFPVLSAGGSAVKEAPLVALTRPGAGGRIETIGHAPAEREDGGRPKPNLLVHFADADSASQLERLANAVRESGRTDAPTAIIAVLAPDVMKQARYTPGIVFADPQDGVWERVWGATITRRPTTLVIGPNGRVTWRHEGGLDTALVADALRKVLVAGQPVRTSTLTSTVRIGQAPPNFLFEYAAGRELTVRKLTGTPITLVFWNSSSRPSIDAVLDLEHTDGRGTPDAPALSRAEGPVVLAINDGEPAERARKSAAAYRMAATLVVDPDRTLSAAYGVSAWPMIVVIDALGIVRDVHYGHLAGGAVDGAISPPAGAAGE